MSMMTVPSLAPGARTLPGELRVPGGNAWGWHRLHQNLAPLTEPPTIDPRIALSGIGDSTDTATRMFPNMASATAHDAVNAVAQVQARYSPQAAAAVAAVLARIQGQAAPQAIASLQRFLARGVSGLGTYYDESGIPMADPIYSSGGTTSGTSTDWASIIAAATRGIDNTLAITQGGSVTGSGIYGSTQTANVAASFPANQLNIGGAGVSGILSSPILLLGIAAVVLVMVSKK